MNDLTNCSACWNCDGTGGVDSGGVTPWGWGIEIMCPACKGSGTLEILDCPNCDNVGWYMVPDPEGRPTMEQCQWCYTVSNSRFNSLSNNASNSKEASK
jgi:hypothetical protein